MKKKIQKISIAFAVIVILQFCLLDGIPGTFISFVYGHGTVYAPGYSALNFLKARPGMTGEKVIEILGEPLNRFTLTIQNKPTVCWQYSQWTDPENKYFKIRVLQFEDDILVEKTSEIGPPFHDK